MKKDSILNEIKDIAKMIYEKDWCEAFAGNISIRITDDRKGFLQCCNNDNWKPIKIDVPFDLNTLNNDVFIITSTQSKMYEIYSKPIEHLSIIFIEQGNLFLMNKNKPSSELLTHLSIYMQRSDIHSILHAHPKHTIALSNTVSTEKELNKYLEKSHSEFPIVFNNGIGMVKYKFKPGTKELAIETSKLFKKYNTVLWQKHGIVSGETTLYKSFDNIDIIEKCSSIALLSNNL